MSFFLYNYLQQTQLLSLHFHFQTRLLVLIQILFLIHLLIFSLKHQVQRLPPSARDLNF